MRSSAASGSWAPAALSGENAAVRGGRHNGGENDRRSTGGDVALQGVRDEPRGGNHGVERHARLDIQLAQQREHVFGRDVAGGAGGERAARRGPR